MMSRGEDRERVTGSIHSRVHFVVHAAMPELQALARERGWLSKGYSHLSFPWQELVFTTDGWRTERRVKSTEVPSPLVDGYFQLNGVARGTSIEFAVHVGVDCHAAADTASYRERADVWLNNGGRNYTQTTT